jgi:hypothetical protein
MACSASVTDSSGVAGNGRLASAMRNGTPWVCGVSRAVIEPAPAVRVNAASLLPPHPGRNLRQAEARVREPRVESQRLSEM